MKRLCCILLLFFMFAIPVSAEENSVSDSFSEEQDYLLSQLPEEAREYLTENGFSFSDGSAVRELNVEGVFKHIFSFFHSHAKAPLRSGFVMLAVILLCAGFSAMDNENHTFTTAFSAVLPVLCSVTVIPVGKTLVATVDALKGCSTFMLAFVPVFAGLVALSGGVVTAVSMNALLLSAAEGVSFTASFLILPLMGGYTALSVCSAVNPLIRTDGITETVKKLCGWLYALISTVFIGVLSIQTVINSASDSLTAKTAKFVIGSAVPVVGSALSEAVTAVRASVLLLRSTVGVCGIIALAAILLPILAELLIWRLVLLVCTATCTFFSQDRMSELLKAVDTMLSMLVGTVLLCGAMFIIALAVILSVGKTA